MKLTPRMRQSAVTLTELLVVLVIISILSTLALPVYINYAERARVATAQEETQLLAQAEENCALEHGLYVPLHILDDLPGTNGVDQSTVADAIKTDLNNNAIDYSIPFNVFTSALANHILALNSPDPRTRTMVNNWKGPFLTFHRTYVPNTVTTNQVNYEDYPLDPWGNPYRFYSPVGIIGNSSTISINGLYNQTDFDGTITTIDNRFARFAVVSWGPDGISDSLNSFQNRDDIFYEFGTIKAETGF